MKKQDTLSGMMFVILAAFFFACMSICIRLAGDVPVIQKSFFRNLVAAAFAVFILLRHHVPAKVPRPLWLPLFMRCAAGTVGILGNFYAVSNMKVADATVLLKMSPFFTVIFSFFILKEKISLPQVCCVALAFLGCVVVVRPGFQGVPLVPALAGLMAGLGSGLAYTFLRYVGRQGLKGPVIVFYFSLFSCLAVAPWVITHYQPMTLNQLGMLMLTGLFAAGGQFSVTAAYRHAPAREISVYDYSQVLFSTVLGFVLFGEMPDAFSFVGYALVIGASVIMFLYNRKHAEGPEENLPEAE